MWALTVTWGEQGTYHVQACTCQQSSRAEQLPAKLTHSVWHSKLPEGLQTALTVTWDKQGTNYVRACTCQPS